MQFLVVKGSDAEVSSQLFGCDFTAIVTAVSVTEAASFAAVFEVQGATTIISVRSLGPMVSASVMVSITSLPDIELSLLILAAAFPKRVSIAEACSDIMGRSSAPRLQSSSAC